MNVATKETELGDASITKEAENFSYKNGSITFADVVGRESTLNNSLIKAFLNELPQSLKEKCIKLFFEGRARRPKDYEMSNDEVELLDYLVSVSDITRIIKETPSSARAFEYLYKQRPAKTIIDQYYVNCLAGSHVNLRMLTIWDNLPRWIECLHKKFGERILIDNIGSGPGLELIGVLQRHPELVDKVHVRNIDPDKVIIDKGRQKVYSLGLQDNFEFVSKKAHEAGIRGAHLLILVGILCTQTPENCIKTLSGVQFFGRKNGLIIYSTNQKSMVIYDPFTDMIMRLAGWFMDYKTDQQSWDLGVHAGWEPISQFFEDSLHFQCMTVASME
jgi:hypothetical protein